MKKYLIIWIWIGIATTAVAQEIGEKYVGLSIGSSIPTNAEYRFYSNEEVWYAMPGFHLNMHYDYTLTKNAGVTVLFNTNSHSYNVDEMVRLLWSTDPKMQWKFKSDFWTSSAFMGGPYYYYRFQKLEYNTRFLMGYSLSKFPSMTVTTFDLSDSKTIEQLDERSFSCAVNLGIGVRYSILNKITLDLNVDYFSTSPVFETSILSLYDITTIPNGKQKMRMANVSFGLGYKLR